MKSPTLKEVADYIKAEGFYDVNAEKFWSAYENRNWCTGKSTKQFPYGRPMVNWHLAVVQWTHTTAHTRLLYKTTVCACGCGRKPRTIIDGKAYAMDRCYGKMKAIKKEPLPVKAELKPIPPKPNRELWREKQQLLNKVKK
uniref:Uncharacterized protein n=1 Tax=viral metagenome TaxID=1070528 RepID=A0A6H1ZNG3_9ZZZZ